MLTTVNLFKIVSSSYVQWCTDPPTAKIRVSVWCALLTKCKKAKMAENSKSDVSEKSYKKRIRFLTAKTKPFRRRKSGENDLSSKKLLLAGKPWLQSVGLRCDPGGVRCLQRGGASGRLQSPHPLYHPRAAGRLGPTSKVGEGVFFPDRKQPPCRNIYCILLLFLFSYFHFFLWENEFCHLFEICLTSRILFHTQCRVKAIVAVRCPQGPLPCVRRVLRPPCGSAGPHPQASPTSP